ncbi:MAG: hypothetical protein ACC707_01860 [Thiohalomonadales bacterium]
MAYFTQYRFLCYKRALFVTILFVATCGVVAAADTDSDRIDLEQLEIQGANELPKVLYIVPWQRSEVDDSPVAVDSMIDEIMVPVDRNVLRRQINYYEKGVFGQ